MPGHHRANTHGYVREHIAVMESMIGRKIILPEVVHHIDGDKLNNAPDNLMLFPDNAVHQKYHYRAKPCHDEQG